MWDSSPAVFKKTAISDASEATKHRPPFGATHPDTHEVALKSQSNGFVSREQATFDANSHVVELRSHIAQALADNTVITRVSAELAIDRTALVGATAARIRAEVAWWDFQATNGIADLANYPESKFFH